MFRNNVSNKINYYLCNSLTNIFRNFFSKLDAVLNAVNVSAEAGQSTNILWEEFIKCSNATLIDAACRRAGRAAWKYSLESLAVMLDNLADDLMTYFREVNGELVLFDNFNILTHIVTQMTL